MNALTPGGRIDPEAAAKAVKKKDAGKTDKLVLEAEAKKKSLDEAKAAFEGLPSEAKEKRKQAADKLIAETKAVAEAEKEFGGLAALAEHH